jgi:hypothetical protein
VGASFSLGETRKHAADVAHTYRGLREFLERLPRDRSLIVTEPRGTGKWKAIAGLDHYRMDSAAVNVVGPKDFYFVVDCPTPTDCLYFDKLVEYHMKRVLRYGSFSFEQIYNTANPWSAARVYRMRKAG